MDKNRRTVEVTARKLGATSIVWHNDSKHRRCSISMPSGRIVSMSFARSPIDAYKLEGWTRQAIIRSGRNDNDPR